MAADELGEKVSTGELEEVIHFCNPTGEGVITREAFVTYNKRKNFA